MHYAEVSVDAILPPIVPMREDQDPAAFRELVADVRARGLLQPVIVTPAGERFRLVAGSRRLAAAIAAELLTVPALVRELTEEEQVAAMVAENVHREQVNPLDEARTFAILQEGTGKTIAALAQLLGKSPSYVAARLQLWEGPEDVKAAVRAGTVSFSAARELLRCLDDEDRAFLLHHASAGGATADTVRRWVTESNARRERAPEVAGAASAAVSIELPAVMMTRCEWGREDTPMERTISFRVCGDHYQYLQQLREQVEALEKREREEADHAPVRDRE